MTAGTIALFSQDAAFFDNILIDTVDVGTPAVVVSAPAALTVHGEGDLIVSAVARNASPAATLDFFLGSSACNAAPLISATGVYTANCGPLTEGVNYTVAAQLNDGANSASDTSAQVGAGSFKVTVGDSITNGSNDKYASDNLSADGRIIGLQGYQPVLSDLTTERSGVPQIVFNEGVGGDDSFDLVYERLDSILKRYPGLDLVVLQIGTNDALGSGGTPSGEGCSYADPPQGHQENPQGVAWQSSCAGTFKGNVQWAINKIAAAGKSVMIPQLPPAFGGGGDPYDSPLSGKRNQRISQYNRVISNELTGYLPGADFFDFLLAGGENRFTLFDDNLHPNSLGMVVFGHLHHNADNPSSPVGDSLPFILEGLCVRVDSDNCENPTPYKQNLMQVGNHPYRAGYKDDQATELLAIPGVLDGGVWINTYNAHRNNARADYLDFNVDLVELGYGASYPDVEVFVLFDSSVSGASLPSWMGGFSQVFEGGLPVRVDTSSSTVPFMNVFKRTYRPDSGNLNVVLGGAESGTTGARANYLVVIKPLAAGGP